MPKPFAGAALFDLDGTLVDTAYDFAESINDIRQLNGLEAMSIDEIRLHVSDGAKAMVKCAFPDHHKTDQSEQIEQLLIKCEENLGAHAQVFDGIHGMIKSLEENNIAWVIITNRNHRFTAPLLEKLQLYPSQGIFICPEQVKQPKPDPEGILQAINALAISPDRCFYAGDHLRDIQAAKNAGIKSIACEYGYIGQHEDISTWQADYNVTNVKALDILLKKLFQIT